MQINSRICFHSPTGTPVYSFRLINSTGAYVELTNRGARWLTAFTPDKDGVLNNVLLTPSNPADDEFYRGAIIGRFANRIGNAQICIDGKTYQLERNDGENTNHGGFSGFDRKDWDWEILEDGVRFSLFSPDGEGGYPGNVHVDVTYHWNDRNELSIIYHGTTDQPTYLNLTNHAYFNLKGNGEKIIGHELRIPTDTILDTTEQFIPTGKRITVTNSPFDFTRKKPIGQELYTNNRQLRWNKGYNHCYVLKEKPSSLIQEAALLTEPETGRTLTVETDLPAVLLYTAGYYEQPDTGVCLEAQYYPDTPSHPDFPSCLLRPHEEYRQKVIFRFGITEQS